MLHTQPTGAVFFLLGGRARIAHSQEKILIPARIRSHLKTLGALALSASVCLALCASPADAHPPAQPVISQVYGGGGNVGAPYQNDFIELFNRSGAPINLSGYSVQYAPAPSLGSWLVTPLTGTLAIGQYLLVAEGNAGGGAGIPLPTADAIGTTNMDTNTGKVALVSSFTPLATGVCTGPQVLDLVGYGTTASCSEGSPITPNASNTAGPARKTAGCTDTNNNFNDFLVSAPTPRNSLSPKNFCFPVPAKPTLSATAPPSPSNNLTPKVIGSAPPLTNNVELYTNASCSGSAVATGSAVTFASTGIPATVAPNSTTTFYALAFDANNTSDCSTTSVTYVEDQIAPPAPTLIASSPASPANDTSPELRGSAADGTTVKLYTIAGCGGGVVAFGSAGTFASPGITATVAADSTTNFYATATDAAGNASTCSPSSLTYVEDSGLPASPTFSSSVPASPANDTTPNILGSAEASSTVKLYTNATCTSPVAATGGAAQFASSGIQVTVLPNSPTTFWATATDAVNNTSACSPTSLTYVEDSTAPAAPTLSSSVPGSPSSDTSPKIVGSAEAGSTVKLYRDSACTSFAASGTAASLASPGIAVSVGANSTTTFEGTATDAAGNTSPCSSNSVTYVQVPDQQPKGAAPVISDLYLTPKRFATNLKRTPVGAAQAASWSGTHIHFSLSEQARVSFTILRRPPRPQRPSPAGSLVKTFGRLLGPGEHSLPFSGRLGNRIFRTGPYRLYVIAIDSDGLVAPQASAPFRVVAR